MDIELVKVMEPNFSSEPLMSQAKENMQVKTRPTLRTQHKYQIYIFVLTFFTYASLHISREAWAFMKDNIKKHDAPGIGLSANQLGTIDMFFLAFYSVGLFISGVLGDAYNKNYLLGIGYLIISAS